jgi:flavin reductase (DIM6/NTAB) family NADH-FMN oxidoreductase RutF
VKALAAERLPARFLDTMASACSSVSVVTTVAAGVPHGTTVSAFCSLSVNPPMILVSLDNTSRLLRHVRDSGRFGLNLLASDQSDLARRFATKAGDKFEGVGHDLAGGAPRLPAAAGWVSCELHAELPGGDHTILLGTVCDAVSTGRAPLTYYSRSFGTHTPVG